MRRIVITVTLLLAGSASAQTLYKCVSPEGTGYQQVPCAEGTRTVRMIETTPEPPPTTEQLSVRARKAEQDRRESEYLSHLAGTDRTFAAAPRSRSRNSTKRVDARHERCESAKARRTRALDKVGLDRTFDLLRKLDADVAAACGH